MATVVAVIMRGGRTFLGGAAARVVDDVGGGRDGAPRPFGCRAAMITRARVQPFRSSGALLSSADEVACS
jgi:hypothetical protein